MNEYVGKICPYCKTTIQENDNIVVCSACDMPHHKECWIENQGCTTFGCTGTIRSVDGSANSVTATQLHYDATFCTNCGAAVSGAFCTNCGTPVSVAPAAAPQPTYQAPQPTYQAPQPTYQAPQPTYQAPQPTYQAPQPTYQAPQPTYQAPQPTYQAPQPTYQAPQPTYQAPQPNYQQPQPNYQQPQSNPYQSAQIDPNVDAMIVQKREYYIPKFQEMKLGNKMTTWNWAAFLFGPYWLAYRKMYAYSGIILAAQLILSLISSDVVYLLNIALWVAFGLLGNYIYMRHLEYKAEELRTLYEPARTVFINKTGGTSGGAAAIAAVAYFLLALLLL